MVKKGLVFLLVVIALLFGTSILFLTKENLEVKNTECQTSVKEFIVNGNSMAPFINPDDTVTALFDYYNCNDIQRGDVVLYRYSGNDNLLIKFVKAVPGDRWELRENNGGYEIIVSGDVLFNAEGEKYLIPENSIKMLKLYIKDYPVIPPQTYLLLGNETDGSLDSTHFGLAGKEDILAKVLK